MYLQWSYGVLLWELTTLAQQPYVEVAACEMSEYLRDGYRLAQPLNCPDDLYKVMAYCWAIQPKDRPKANAILEYLAAFHRQLDSFIWQIYSGLYFISASINSYIYFHFFLQCWLVELNLSTCKVLFSYVSHFFCVKS